MAQQGHRRHWGIGNVVAPPRFILFVVATFAGIAALKPVLGWRYGIMSGFDIGALCFFAACVPLLFHKAAMMRISACRNDANRAVLLLIGSGVVLVIFAAVASELKEKSTKDPWLLVLTIGTLALAWMFANFIYALHYAHLYYTEKDDGSDSRGVTFPETPEPDYWDFIYFAVCLGMTFQTSDMNITNGRMRRVVTLHCLEAFVFNLGVIAFTINVLGAS